MPASRRQQLEQRRTRAFREAAKHAMLARPALAGTGPPAGKGARPVGKQKKRDEGKQKKRAGGKRAARAPGAPARGGAGFAGRLLTLRLHAVTPPDSSGVLY